MFDLSAWRAKRFIQKLSYVNTDFLFRKIKSLPRQTLQRWTGKLIILQIWMKMRITVVSKSTWPRLHGSN